MPEIVKPKNYETVPYEETYDDGGFMDDSPKWLKGLAIAGMAVGGLAILGSAGYGCYKLITRNTDNGWRFVKFKNFTNETDALDYMSSLENEYKDYSVEFLLKPVNNRTSFEVWAGWFTS